VPVTTEEIAQLAGCSTATVSRVLNESGPVSELIAKAVRDAVAKAGMPPKRRSRHAAAAAREGVRKSGLISVVMHLTARIERMDVINGRVELGSIMHIQPDRFFMPENRYCNTHFRRIIDGAMDESNVWKDRPVLRTTNTLDDPHLLEDLAGGAGHGLILLGNDGPTVDPFVRRCKVPVVSLISGGRDGIACAASDDVPGMQQAVNHLKQLGHSKIGYITCSGWSPMLTQRFAAFKLAMADAALAINHDWVFDGSIHVADIRTWAEKLLGKSNRPTAIIAAYDGAAFGVMLAAKANKLAVPKDLSVIGFGNQDIADLTQPPLTSVHVPAYEIGRAAVKLLVMQRMQPEPTDGLLVRLPTHLVERASTAKAR
jgi:DNA-binding LacI/PurR family transcriptional regulator